MERQAKVASKDTKEELIDNVEKVDKGKEASNIVDDNSNLTKTSEDSTGKSAAKTDGNNDGAKHKLCEALIVMVVIFLV